MAVLQKNRWLAALFVAMAMTACGGIAVHAYRRVDPRRHFIRILIYSDLHVYPVHRRSETVEVLHRAQSHQDHRAVELLVTT